VRMNWFDRIMVVGGGAGTVGTTAAKMATTAKWALSFAAIIAALGQLVWVVIGGLLLLTFRTVLGYRRARINRDSQRTRHLYYQNISNNLGAISTLVAMIAQEEEKEAVLAYAFCHVADPPLRSAQELAERVNQYLKRRFALDVDFDAEDAVQTLDLLGLWSEPPHSGRLHVCPPDQALARLAERRCRPRAAGHDPALHRT
jgi:ABC-type multidrug transport system fused ATPase/permease subunit